MYLRSDNFRPIWLAIPIMTIMAVPALAQPKVERTFWESVKGCTSAAEVQLYLDAYPAGRFVAEAQACLRRIGGVPPASPTPASPAPPQPRPDSEESSLNLSREERALVQRGLNAMGFNVGRPDGLFGSSTRTAIRKFQARQGTKATGYLTVDGAKALIDKGREAAEEEARKAEERKKEEEAKRRAEAERKAEEDRQRREEARKAEEEKRRKAAPKISPTNEIDDAMKIVRESLHPRLEKLEVTKTGMTFVALTRLDISRGEAANPKFCRLPRRVSFGGMVVNGLGKDPERPSNPESGIVVLAQTNFYRYVPPGFAIGTLPDYVCNDAYENDYKSSSVLLPLRPGADPQKLIAALRRLAGSR